MQQLPSAFFVKFLLKNQFQINKISICIPGIRSSVAHNFLFWIADVSVRFSYKNVDLEFIKVLIKGIFHV